MLTITLTALAIYLAAATFAAAAERVTLDARRWHPPAGWLRGAFCIHRHESHKYGDLRDWHRAWIDWAGRPSSYAGGMQFLQSTWQRAGGRGEPWQWGPREQVYRAFVIWTLNDGSWREWGTARACGLR